MNEVLNKNKNINSTIFFNNLLENKMFRKFLNNKLENSKNNEEVSMKFIENLDIKKTNRNKKIEKKQINENSETTSNANYSIFYNEDNYKIIHDDNNYRKTVNTFKIPRINNIKMTFNNRYNNDNLIPQNDNLYENKIIKNPRFTMSYSNFKENDSELAVKNQKLHDKILELQNEIRVSKNEMNKKDSELKKYFSSYDKMNLENNLNKEKINELKKELKLQKGEMNEKLYKISELENINNTLKAEMTKLKKNYEEETTTNNEAKKNYDLMKSNYNDIKNQYDLLNIKFQSLTDENFNFKRDKALYENQIKVKNKMIESLIENKANIINNKLYDTYSSEDKNVSNHEMFLDYLKNKKIPNDILKNEDIENGMKKNYKNENGSNEKYKTDIDYTKFDNLNYPELQSKRDELVNERKNVNNVFSKISLKSNYKGHADKRKELENKLHDINCDLAIIKLRMKKLKS